MKQFVLVWGMRREAFTLMEVMVAVMIVSVVIGAIYKLQGNAHHIFFKLHQQANSEHYLSLLLWNKNYGFEEDSVDIYRLVDDFVIDDREIRRLKNIKLNIDYKRVLTIDMADYNASSSGLFEIGKSSLKKDDFSSSLYRLRLE